MKLKTRDHSLNSKVYRTKMHRYWCIQTENERSHLKYIYIFLYFFKNKCIVIRVEKLKTSNHFFKFKHILYKKIRYLCNEIESERSHFIFKHILYKKIQRWWCSETENEVSKVCPYLNRDDLKRLHNELRSDKGVVPRAAVNNISY